ncbi:hypothetical protein GCM10007938_24890 [Vibrio zhanjiangensis]|uniref:Killing trait domain-containing protein n=1 Tax=Vibrio zhanjiangensis TaxID=1046128 RepID=A0ABQ6EZN7_9VIBR|nr:RebB family R body protein [Vibrio zhanjiangensis]GLT18708.1 hypothetical protein GCM10007938_24890 [Vibrio zhanjiangensis]
MSDQDYTTLQKFSDQPTSIAETTLSETIGLTMHNLVANQQQSQVTTSASVTNACARLLAIPQASSQKGSVGEEFGMSAQRERDKKKKGGLAGFFSRS